MQDTSAPTRDYEPPALIEYGSLSALTGDSVHGHHPSDPVYAGLPADSSHHPLTFSAA